MRSKSLYFSLLGASLLFAMPPVLWPQLDLAVAAYFLRTDLPIHPAQWWWVTQVNEYVPDTFRALAMLSLAAWGVVSLIPALRRWALPLAFVGLSVALGPGLATWAVKEHHQRARPLDVVQFGGQQEFKPALVRANQCSDNCAFSSGHAACGFFLASLLLIDVRRRWWWMGAGILAGLAVSLARVSVGAHWLSDVLWSFPITLAVSGLVWQLLSLVYRRTTPATTGD